MLFLNQGESFPQQRMAGPDFSFNTYIFIPYLDNIPLAKWVVALIFNSSYSNCVLYSFGLVWLQIKRF